MTEIPIIKKPVHRFAEQISRLISINRDLRRQERRKVDSCFISPFVFENHSRRSALFIVTLEQIPYIALVFLLLNMNK